MSVASISDIITYGDTATRGPVVNKSVIALAPNTFTLVLPINAARKFLLIKPLVNHIHVHFLTPGANTGTISTANSFTVGAGNSDAPLRFEIYVPTNAVYVRSNTSSTDIVIFEG